MIDILTFALRSPVYAAPGVSRPTHLENGDGFIVSQS